MGWGAHRYEKIMSTASETKPNRGMKGEIRPGRKKATERTAWVCLLVGGVD